MRLSELRRVRSTTSKGAGGMQWFVECFFTCRGLAEVRWIRSERRKVCRQLAVLWSAF